MGLRQHTNCWRCNSPDATFLHIAWSCGPIQRFWGQILTHITAITGITIPHTPLATILGVLESTPPKKSKLAAILLTMAKRQIAIRWGTQNPPTVREWVTNVTFCKTQLTHYWEQTPIRLRPKDIREPYVHWLSTVVLDD